MRVEPVSGRVLSGPLTDVYVYEAPVRLWHWVTVLCITVLGVTGYFISAPLPAMGVGADASTYFVTGWIRMVHFTAGWILAVAFLVRLYWVIVGNHHARSIFYIPFWSGAWWRGLFRQAGYYAFVRRESDHWIGHNPMAQAAMFFMFTLGLVVMILTGFGLYAQGYPTGGIWTTLFGWVTVLLGDPQTVRTVHIFTMWYVLIFAFIHMYMVFREDIMSGESVIGTMINGIRMFKREPRA